MGCVFSYKEKGENFPTKVVPIQVAIMFFEIAIESAELHVAEGQGWEDEERI